MATITVVVIRLIDFVIAFTGFCIALSNPKSLFPKSTQVCVKYMNFFCKFFANFRQNECKIIKTSIFNFRL